MMPLNSKGKLGRFDYQTKHSSSSRNAEINGKPMTPWKSGATMIWKVNGGAYASPTNFSSNFQRFTALLSLFCHFRKGEAWNQLTRQIGMLPSKMTSFIDCQSSRHLNWMALTAMLVGNAHPTIYSGFVDLKMLISVPLHLNCRWLGLYLLP